MDPIIRTEFVEKLAFLEKPDYATRQALKAAGFRFNGVQWSRTRGTTSTLSHGQLEMILKPEEAFA